MPICKICEAEFEITSKYSHGRIYCYDCCPEYRRGDKASYVRRQIAMRQAMKRQGIKMLGGCCSRCGYNKCIGALQFHHKNGKLDKSFNFNDSFHSWERYKEELDKCILLCANCHAEEHWNQEHFR